MGIIEILCKDRAEEELRLMNTMLVLTLEEIKKHGISGNELSEITFQNKVFTKGSTYSQRCRESAIAYGENYSITQGECIIIDNGTYLTLWLERKTANLAESQESIVPQIQPKSESIPEKVANKGNSLANTNQITTETRSLRKYRGSYY
jgi:hypothetical protein